MCACVCVCESGCVWVCVCSRSGVSGGDSRRHRDGDAFTRIPDAINCGNKTESIHTHTVDELIFRYHDDRPTTVIIVWTWTIQKKTSHAAVGRGHAEHPHRSAHTHTHATRNTICRQTYTHLRQTFIQSVLIYRKTTRKWNPHSNKTNEKRDYPILCI